MQPLDLACRRVSKRYRLGARRPFADWLSRFTRRQDPAPEFWALRDITFDVRRGEVLGVIGPNGAGKSTLLKLLSRITAPTEGEIEIHGRLSALIEIGSGFHPELTGRENVFLNGTILGMTRREVAAKLDSIVEFSGIGRFLDTPVKWYSSGMYVRLGFSVAAHLDPDILLVDEVLAVGDAEFQARCLRRMAELTRRPTTILLISHDLGTVERLCERALLLTAGRLVAEGPARDVVTAYQRSIEAEPLAAMTGAASGVAAIRALTLHDVTGAETGIIASGHPLTVRLSCDAAEGVPEAIAEVAIYAYDSGILQTQLGTEGAPLALLPGSNVIEFHCEALGLLPGVYTLGATIRTVEEGRAVAWWFGRTTLYVQGPARGKGRFSTPHTWRILGSLVGDR
jgi:ABC-type polysaccharide/polyol phosphate transport system ATPase subunit